MTTPTDYAKLGDEIEAVAKDATPGPWFQWPTKDGGRVCAPFPVEGEEPLSIADFDMDQRLDYDTTSCANAALSALPRAEADDGWRTIESAPKTDPVNMRALPFLGWCPDKTAPLGGDIRVIWWEPVMQRADETSPRARWYGDRDMEEQPTHWRPLPAPPAQAGER